MTDDAGRVLPGVTVEATSGEVVEGRRAVVTDGAGRYALTDLRPGEYALLVLVWRLRPREKSIPKLKLCEPVT